MCGIAGSYHFKNFNPLSSIPEDETKLALLRTSHRGPDFTSVKTSGGCILGHNRLSILDLSAAANQPMCNESGRFWIVFNGEIFNYKELRVELELQGIQFRTTSDTEVLLQLLIIKKEKALNMLNGFFAFAFYDLETHELLLARDRFGEKPLWYYQDENAISFASELKGLVAYNIPKEIDIISLSLFLQFSYIPSPHSIYKKVFKLNPGHFIRCSDGKSTTEKWYEANEVIQEKIIPTKIHNQFDSLLQDAVNIRMHADVAVGCFLSGGMDSSVIALLASRKQSDIQTFSIAFKDEPFLDETKFALEVASHIGSRHEVIPIHTSNLFDEISKVWQNLDEPFSDSSSIAVSLLSSKVKNKVSVALSGDGADEILGGYNKHSALLKSLKSGITNSALPYFIPFIDALPENRKSKFGNRSRQLKKYARGLELSLKDRYVLWASWAKESLCEELVTQEVSVRKGARVNHFVQDIIQEDFNTLLLADQQLVLSNDMLVKVDMMSMMHSLEVRPPFLDHRVVEFVNALPVSFKLNQHTRKIILAETYQDQLPKSVFNRPKKGFEVPLEAWLRKDLKSLVFETLSGENLTSKEFLRKEIVQKVLDMFYKKGKSELASLVYSLLVFEHWFRTNHKI